MEQAEMPVPPKMKSGKVAGHLISRLREHNIMQVVARRALTKKAQLPEKPGLDDRCVATESDAALSSTSNVRMDLQVVEVES
ncbi:MAG: hypothetical protein KDA52_02640, partial [Planctomycetaceae bacterium]|nr:hypothetical protein [Planctomycetaceae bacterium]